MNDNSQSIWIGLSFLAVGLAMGLIFSGQNTSLQANIADQDGVVNEPTGELALEFVSVSADDDAILGDPDAPVTIIEFSDYECPYCSSFWQSTLPQIQANYIDKGLVKLVYRDYALPIHPEAGIAAEAAECAGEESDEAFYEMHDLIFARASEWAYQENAEEVLAGFGDELGLDIRSCLANGDMTDEVADDFAAGRSYGVTGTPSFFINGWMLVGAQPYEIFESLIESELSN